MAIENPYRSVASTEGTRPKKPSSMSRAAEPIAYLGERGEVIWDKTIKKRLLALTKNQQP